MIIILLLILLSILSALNLLISGRMAYLFVGFMDEMRQEPPQMASFNPPGDLLDVQPSIPYDRIEEV